MKTKVISCISVKNEIESLALHGGVDCEYLDFSFHAFPDKAHDELQKRINSSQDYCKIVLTYGRCSTATAGLVSPAVPLVLPNVHDCIGLLIGGSARRQELACRNPAAYYFSPGWLEFGRTPYEEYREYEQKYGQDDAEYLIETLYGKYQEAIFIRTCVNENLTGYRQRVQEIAAFFHWTVSEVEGDLSLLQAVIACRHIPDVLHIAAGKPVSW